MITKTNQSTSVISARKNSKFSILEFAQISTELEQKLIGGFSQTISIVGPTTTIDDGASNNCLGGNCTNGCGMGGQNSCCNSAAGCSNATYNCNGGTNYVYGCK
jgi:hypothetical protein